MVLMSSMEIINFPEYLSAVARIMKQAGKSWTLCSEAFEATNSGIQIGVSDIAAVLVQRIVDGAEKLKVKTVISPECGHAYTALRWEGPNLVGRPYTFEVLHILEVLDGFRSQGLLKTSGFEDALLTFHDPCQLVRRGGVLEAAAQSAESGGEELRGNQRPRQDELVLRRRRRSERHRRSRTVASAGIQDQESRNWKRPAQRPWSPPAPIAASYWRKDWNITRWTFRWWG